MFSNWHPSCYASEHEISNILSLVDQKVKGFSNAISCVIDRGVPFDCLNFESNSNLDSLNSLNSLDSLTLTLTCYGVVVLSHAFLPFLLPGYQSQFDNVFTTGKQENRVII